MCGIVGYIGMGKTKDILMHGLKRLEYRGYDSAGLVTFDEKKFVLKKVAGRIRDLENATKDELFPGHIGIAHTRWATHGEPNELNAHPHCDCKGRVVVVHNGIIENYDLLKRNLEKTGHVIKSKTDTEIIAHLIEEELDKDNDSIVYAVQNALKRVEGSFALGIMFSGAKDMFIAARRKSPLVIGLGKNENYIASDVSAIVDYTKKVIYLGDDEMAIIKKDRVKVMDLSGEVIIPRTKTVRWGSSQVEKQGYPYFTLKEIHQQPDILRNLYKNRVSKNKDIVFSNLNLTHDYLSSVNKIFIQACGTSYHAGLVGKYLLERYLRIPVEVDISSEFRYRNPIVDKDTLLISISQSGETADTIAGLEEAARLGAKTLSLCNVAGSTITRISDAVIHINAGPEMGVASTKAYMAQLSNLFFLTLYLGKILNKIPEPLLVSYLSQFRKLPEYLDNIINCKQIIKNMAYKYFHCENFLFLGRGISFPTSLEGALKLKEISYINANAYAAGELKHGPIALIDENTPVFCMMLKDANYEKMISNVQEVKARKGQIIALATEGNNEVKLYADDIFYIPAIQYSLSPLLAIVPMQLFAYYVAVMRGCDVDKPRNLAKSVTVE